MEISRRPLRHPIVAIQKWIMENRYGDTLLENLSRLMGRYSEVKETSQTRKNRSHIKVAPGNLGGEWEQEEETQITKVIQSYVDVLPVRKVTEYLKDFREIIRQLGFHDIVLFIDEADHLPHIEEFLRMLTRSRELLFTAGYTYIIAGSVEVARYTEAMGAIFDHLIYLQPLAEDSFHNVIERRLQSQKKLLKLGDIFASGALHLIFQKSRGILKEGLRLAENSIKNAAKERASLVTVEHCLKVIEKETQEITLELQEKHILLLKFLANTDYASPSDKELQKAVSLSRSYLRTLLEDLSQKGYIHKEKRGKKSFYLISSQYRPYFAK